MERWIKHISHRAWRSDVCDRNTITNQLLAEADIKSHQIPGSELVRAVAAPAV